MQYIDLIEIVHVLKAVPDHCDDFCGQFHFLVLTGKVQNFSFENESYLNENKNHFQINSLAQNLALKQKLGAQRKW